MTSNLCPEEFLTRFFNLETNLKSDSYNSVESGDIETHGHGLRHDSRHAEAIQSPIVSQKSAS